MPLETQKVFYNEVFYQNIDIYSNDFFEIDHFIVKILAFSFLSEFKGFNIFFKSKEKRIISEFNRIN